MIKKLKYYLLISCITVISGQSGLTQATINSPLTFIGLGEIHPDDLHERGFSGYTSTAAYGDYESNIRNPAALGSLKAANFDVGMSMRSIGLKHNDMSSSAWHGSFDYLLLSFPIFNPINDILNRDERKLNWGMMIGLKPYSNLGYNIRTEKPIADDLLVNKHYQGSGGTYKIMWGNGFRYKDLAAGVRLEYILGSMNFDVVTSIANEPYSFTTMQERSLYMKAFNYDVGLQYNIVLKRGQSVTKEVEGTPIRYINLGVSASTGVKADFSQDIVNINRSNIGNITDTLYAEKNIEGSGFLPGHIDFGIMYAHDESFTIALDFKHDAWSQYENPFTAADNYKLKNSFRYGAGLQYVPEPSALTGYFKRVKYYLGAHYGSDPRVINGEQLIDYGASAGMALPFVGRMSRAYAAISIFYSRKEASTVKEDYFGIGLSFKGTDNQWFLKSKFN